MNINEPAFVKKFVDCEREPAPHTKNRAEQIGARSQMRNLAKKFRRMSFFLEWVGIVRQSDDLDLVRGQLPFLPFPLGCDQFAFDANGRARGQLLDLRVIRERTARDDLKVL